MIFCCETKVASFTTVFIRHSAIDYFPRKVRFNYFLIPTGNYKARLISRLFHVWANNYDSASGLRTFRRSTQFSACPRDFHILSRDIYKLRFQSNNYLQVGRYLCFGSYKILHNLWVLMFKGRICCVQKRCWPYLVDNYNSLSTYFC